MNLSLISYVFTSNLHVTIYSFHILYIPFVIHIYSYNIPLPEYSIYSVHIHFYHTTLADCQTLLGLALQRFIFTQSESGLSISFFNKSIPQDLADIYFTSVGLWNYKILLDKGVGTGTDIVRGFLHLVYIILTTSTPPPT